MLLTVVLLWSGNFTAMRYAVDSFHPLAFSSVRFALGAAVYALVVWWREGSLRIARRDLGAIVLLAAIGIFVNQVAVIYAVQKAGAANVGMLMASAPIIAALLARRLGHERIGAAAPRRHRRRGHGCPARALRRRRRRRRAADRLAARSRSRPRRGRPTRYWCAR